MSTKPVPADGDEPTERPPVNGTFFWARAAVFVLILAWIVGAPFYRQILGGKNKHARPWVMFSGISVGAMDAKFYEQQADGTRRKLDRYEALGAERPKNPRKRRLKGKHGAWGIARQLCRRLGPDADIRAVVRRATKDGWVLDYDGEENMCEVAPPKRQRRRGKRRGR